MVVSIAEVLRIVHRPTAGTRAEFAIPRGLRDASAMPDIRVGCTDDALVASEGVDVGTLGGAIARRLLVSAFATLGMNLPAKRCTSSAVGSEALYGRDPPCRVSPEL
jgi:hypothetical protein